MFKKKIDNLFEESGVKKDLKFINENTPKNKNIFYFLLTFILSFFYFFNVFIISVFYFIYYSIFTIINKIKKKNKIINVYCVNNFENSFLFFYKELVVNYAKVKAFVIWYNFLKIIYKKKNSNTNIKLLIFAYLFKRIFKFFTLIPFTIFKINCTIYKRCKNKIKLTSKKIENQSSLKAVIDHILLNLYLEKISDEIKQIQNYKIILKENNIEFNPPKFNKSNFKNSFDYFSKKKDMEDISEFSLFKNKKNDNSIIYKHTCKIYNIFKEDITHTKNVLFTETKVSKITDKYGNEIKTELKNIGYKNKNIEANKAGPFIMGSDNKEGVLEELNGSDIKALAESKNNFSWQLLQDIFYKKKTIYLNENNVIYQKEKETLREFYKKYYNCLNNESKSFLDAKEKFDSENADIIENISNEEYVNLLKNDYQNWLNFKNDFLSDFNNKYNNDFISDSDDF